MWIKWCIIDNLHDPDLSVILACDPLQDQEGMNTCWVLWYTDDTTLLPESEEELKSLSMKVKEGSEKASLKLNIQKTKIMASGLITSWQIDRKMWKQCQISFRGAPKSLQTVTAATSF